ncbi:MAG TPA: hypothetical protein VGC83_20010, partial [Solirubrobacteraceae bacterium]
MLGPIGPLREDAPMGVLAIWRYPVKAMLGELLERRVRLERSDARAQDGLPADPAILRALVERAGDRAPAGGRARALRSRAGPD